MELSEFVRRTIEQIVAGVKGSHEFAVANGAAVALTDNDAVIEFDVAVTTTEQGESKKGAGIFIAGFGLGAQGKSGSSTSSESRIKFSVCVTLPRAGSFKLS